MDTRATIINACAGRQRIYYDKKIRALKRDNDDRFDRMQVAQEVCDLLCAELLDALKLAPHDVDADELIEPVVEVAAHG